TADLLIDKHAPWGLYNLSATYFMIERWSLVFGSTEEGLSVLLKQGRKEFRPQFHQMNAEMHLKNHDILSAIQELDTGIRQDPNPDEAARMLYRVGDIYYGLNNFELAEEVYGTAVKIDKAQTQFNPTQTLLTGESAFWLGNFERARQLMAAALEAAISTDRDWLTESKALPWLRLRIADTWLAQLENAKLSERAKIAEETRFAYYKVEFEHPHTEAARIAEVRGACLELPTYEGKNVRHAREVLESVKVKKDVPEVLVELVEACLVGSYTERDRTPEMVAKVLEFSKKYPNSKFIERMIGRYLFSATEFFEKRRKTLYPVVSEALSRSLFEAYVDTSRSSKAIEFWPRIGLFGKTEEEKLRIAAFLSEVIGVSLPGKKSVADSNYVKQLRQVVADLEQLKWKAEPSKYTQAMVSRLLNGPRSKDHVLWIGRGAEVWAKNDPDAQCGVLYPIVSRISEQRQDKESRKFVRSKLDDIFPDEWSDIETNNPGCAQAWLDLEAKNYTLAERSIRYASRADWRLFGPWLERIWTHSEDLEKSGQRGNAIKVWEKIANQAPKESFEARMAKTRLQPRQTEVEALWW
ncbi:MAG: tetratricopeptide repeat protein, partial [Proteobacteria bacterium]|nr:tetratricopeptide repeat protein [Pseudomonadota bacterium]